MDVYTNGCRQTYLLYVCVHVYAYNEKKYVEILLCYKQLFIKGNVFIGELGIFDAEVFLHYSWFFIKGNFIIGRVECMYIYKQTHKSIY